MTRSEDERWMRRCLELAALGQGRTAPNPMVGCVIVGRDGQVIAEGYHRGYGEAHAEADALSHLCGRAPGATMYVSLEPCRHTSKRKTSPCAPRVAAAGVARLVIGMGDPIRSHAGGARWLAGQGVAVTRDVLRTECAHLNRAFTSWAVRKRPWFVIKAGVTLDGRIATRSGDSKWITSAPARADARRLRDQLDVIMVGIGTVLADDPRLTARGVRGGRDPIRLVVDSRLRTPTDALLLPKNTRSDARVIIATTQRAARNRERRLLDAGAEVWRLGRDRVDLAALASVLAEQGVCSVLVEGGGRVHASMIDAGLADELRLYLAPKVVGGPGPSWVGGAGVAALVDAARFEFIEPPERIGPDLLLQARAIARRRR